jgi:hypothetical protein
MSILRSTDADGSQYYFESDGKLTVKNSVDVDPILKKNKQDYTMMEMVILHQKN